MAFPSIAEGEKCRGVCRIGLTVDISTLWVLGRGRNGWANSAVERPGEINRLSAPTDSHLPNEYYFLLA